MTPALLRESDRWHVEWYARFDASDDRLEPANFRRERSFATKADAERYARRVASRAMGGVAEIYESAGDDA